MVWTPMHSLDDDANDADLRARLAYIREEMLGLTQRKAARLLGTYQPRISDAETGARIVRWFYVRRLRDLAATVLGQYWQDRWIFEWPTEEERKRFGWRKPGKPLPKMQQRKERHYGFKEW